MDFDYILLVTTPAFQILNNILIFKNIMIINIVLFKHSYQFIFFILN